LATAIQKRFLGPLARKKSPKVSVLEAESLVPLGFLDYETSFRLKRELVLGETPCFHSNPEYNQKDQDGQE
jgi:hypothetical protein